MRANLNRSLHSLRLLRRLARWAQHTLLHGSLRGAPVFFANSFPKSGTHLLTQVMSGFTRLGPAVDSGLPAVVTFDGFTGRKRALSEILVDLDRFQPGDIGYGHLHDFPEVMQRLSSDGWCAYFILRDPRDVVVSHVHYVAEMAPNHIHHRYYHEQLATFDERLTASIQGVPAEALSRAAGVSVPEPLPDINARFAPFTGWLDCPQVLALRYEDLVRDRRAALERVLDHAVQRGFPLRLDRPAARQILEDSIDPQRSPTFRSGKTGGWKAAFTPQHTALFNRLAGDLLARLGYPSDTQE
ncbi:MAG: hypothetical protein ACKOC5_01215 [Chloroflexota bacterium]